MAEEKISEFECISIETSKAEKQREQGLKKKTEQNIQGLWNNYKMCNNYKSCNISVIGIPEGEKRGKGIEEIFETIMTEKFPQINDRCQIMDPGN